MMTVVADLGRVPGWKAALDGRPDWDTLLDGFDCIVDYPGSYFYRELAEAYPDAKVLLSVRDGKDWARSLHDTIWSILFGDTVARHLADAEAVINPGLAQFTEWQREMFVRSGLLGPDPEIFDENVLVASMERHNAEVREAIPAERLLEWSPKDGWEPLCAFLNRPVPDEPLPRVNDSAAFTDNVITRSLSALNEWQAQRTVA